MKSYSPVLDIPNLSNIICLVGLRDPRKFLENVSDEDLRVQADGKIGMILEDDGIRIYGIRDRFDLKTDSENPEIIQIEFTHENGEKETDKYKAFLYYGFDEIGSEIGSFMIRKSLKS